VKQEYICNETDIICINNRNISNFETDSQKAKELSGIISENILTVAGSGISDPANLLDTANHRFKGFMISEAFMKNTDPGEAFRIFMKELNQKRQ
jgi:indole-3-glycerol phosphate synthase